MTLPKKSISKSKVFYFLAIIEAIYLLYVYAIADPISLWLSADGFLEKQSNPIAIFLSISFVPVFEELTCRSFLNHDFKYLWVTLPFLGLIGWIFYFDYLPVSIIMAMSIIVILVVRYNLTMERIRFFLSKNFTVFFYLSSFLFAFMHIPVINSNSIELSFLTKFIVVMTSIFPISIILSKIRVAFGLRYSILLHSISNAAILILNSIFYHSI